MVLSNLWLFRPLLKKVMPLISAQAAAMLRTTIAFTMQQGSAGYNVLPQEASVCANMRFIPHQGMEESLKLIRQRAEQYGLEMEVEECGDFTPPVDIRGEAWQQAEAAVKKTFPGLPVSPYVMTGATDCAFWQEICPNCVRFAPVVYGPEQMKGMHGLNENISVDCLPGAVDFYKNLIDLSK
jgi:carboxypeptidase PM20D1